MLHHAQTKSDFMNITTCFYFAFHPKKKKQLSVTQNPLYAAWESSVLTSLLPPCCSAFCCMGATQFHGKVLQLKGYNEVYNKPLQTENTHLPFFTQCTDYSSLCVNHMSQKRPGDIAAVFFLSISNSHEMNQQTFNESPFLFLPSFQAAKQLLEESWLDGR